MRKEFIKEIKLDRDVKERLIYLCNRHGFGYCINYYSNVILRKKLGIKK